MFRELHMLKLLENLPGIHGILYILKFKGRVVFF